MKASFQLDVLLSPVLVAHPRIRNPWDPPEGSVTRFLLSSGFHIPGFRSLDRRPFSAGCTRDHRKRQGVTVQVQVGKTKGSGTDCGQPMPSHWGLPRSTPLLPCRGRDSALPMSFKRYQNSRFLYEISNVLNTGNLKKKKRKNPEQHVDQTYLGNLT